MPCTPKYPLQLGRIEAGFLVDRVDRLFADARRHFAVRLDHYLLELGALGDGQEMEAGISDHVWSMQEIAAQVKDVEPKKRGPYK